MGVINVTPDSFSDGGGLGGGRGGFSVDVDKALMHASVMVAEGAVILDVGGESTRPGAEPVSDEEQMDRVLPLIAALRQRLDVCISVDTSSAAVMKEAVAAGAEIINDVRALTQEGALEAAAASTAAVCLMHSQGEPATMQDDPRYEDVVAEVEGFLSRRAGACREAGIEARRILLDPGFGFGKTPRHNFLLLRELPRLRQAGYPLLAGVSRKSMIGAATGREVGGRLAGSVAATVLALQGGAAVIRSHDVAATQDAIRVYSAYSQP